MPPETALPRVTAPRTPFSEDPALGREAWSETAAEEEWWGLGGGRERVLEAKRRLGVGELAKLAPGESIRTVFRLCFRPQGRRMFLKLLVL